MNMEYTERVKLIIQTKIRNAVLLAILVVLISIWFATETENLAVILLGIIFAFGIYDVAKNSVAKLGMFAEMSDNLYAVRKLLEAGEKAPRATNSSVRDSFVSRPSPSSGNAVSLGRLAEEEEEKRATVRTWKCPKCNGVNPSSSRCCKECGYLK